MTYLKQVYADVLDFAPGYVANPGGQLPLAVDEEQQLRIRGPVMTDESGFRTNFANSSLAVAIGTCVFTNGSPVITGTGFILADLHVGDYVWSASDTFAAAVQVDSFSDTEIYLVSNYVGTSGSAVANRQFMKQVVGTGTSLTVSSGTAVVACGTTINSVFELKRLTDYQPLSVSGNLTFASRVVNQTSYFGAWEDAATIRYFAWFVFDGITNTSVKCVTGRNPTSAPAAGEQQSTTVTITATTTAQDYRIEIFADRVTFYVAEVLKATHKITVPHPTDVFTTGYRSVNGGVAPVSYNVTLQHMQARNFNSVDTSPVQGIPQPCINPVAADFLCTATVNGSLTSAGTTTATPATPTANILSSAASTNGTIVKGSAGTLYSVVVSNVGAGAAYLKFHNSTTVTAGTTAVAITVTVPASGTVSLEFGALGMRFGTGICLSITGAAADNDTTNVAAAQVKVLTSFI